MTTDRIAAIQDALRGEGLDGWLFYDFRRSNPLAYRILGLSSEGHITRRWLYWIPRDGEPTRIVSALESGRLDSLPGRKAIFRSWRALHGILAEMLPPGGRVAMEYSPAAAIPVVARVDAGTVEMIRALGVDVASSADLVQMFEARLSPEQWASHQAAAAHLLTARREVAQHMADALRADTPLTEAGVQAWLADFLTRHGLVADHGAIVAVNGHASDPHYEPSASHDTPIRRGDVILIDYWAKVNQPGAVMADYTWVFYAGEQVPKLAARIFAVAAEARDTAIALVRQRVTAGQALHGYEVDDAARGVITAAGYGDYFVHRTGHSIGEDTHGNGANIDNLETQDQRRLIPRTLFSIEPGIYLPDVGVRTEVNVYLGDDATVIVTGDPQPAIEPLL